MYADVQGCLDRYGDRELTILADPGKTGTRDDDRLKRALKDACEEIDAYVRQRYSLPLADPPQLLARLECEIAVYRLATDAAKLTDERRQRYEDAVKLLKLVADGKVSLGAADSDPAPAAGPAVQVSSSPRVLTRDAVRGIL